MTEIAPAAAGTAEARALKVHFLDGQPLLFDEQRQKLYAADRMAALVLRCLQDGLDLDAIERKLAATASLSPAAARRVLRDALAQLERAASGRDAAATAGSAHPLSGPPPFSGAEDRTAGPPAVGTNCRIAIAGVRVELVCPERGTARRVLAAFAHLATTDEVPPHLRIDVRGTEGGYVVFQDREPVLRVAELEGLTPALKAHLVQQVLARADYRLAVHAAALARDGRVLLLPGDEGSGKSTLAAALMARGFSLLGDDTVLLESDLRVRGVPFALAVKAGAWDLLKPHHPALFGLPVDRRPDGRVVRYLRPGAVAAEPLAARFMVFPSWNRATAAGLERLSRVEALQRFLPGCYASARKLQASELAELISWIERIDCYTLDSSDLADAVALVERLWESARRVPVEQFAR